MQQVAQNIRSSHLCQATCNLFSPSDPFSLDLLFSPSFPSFWPHQLSHASPSQDLMILKFLPEMHCLFYNGLQEPMFVWISLAAWQLLIHRHQLSYWMQESLWLMDSLLLRQDFLTVGIKQIWKIQYLKE